MLTLRKLTSFALLSASFVMASTLVYADAYGSLDGVDCTHIWGSVYDTNASSGTVWLTISYNPPFGGLSISVPNGHFDLPTPTDARKLSEEGYNIYIAASVTSSSNPTASVKLKNSPIPLTCVGTSGPYIKHGNNGVVNCNTFCAGSEWGRVGTAVSSDLHNFPCDQTPGYLGGAELTCNCFSFSGGEFVKHGNNGDVSCETFCQGPQWGQVGTSCAKTDAVNVRTDLTPGFIHNGMEMSCNCQ